MKKKINFVVQKMNTKVNKEGGKNNDKKIDKNSFDTDF